MFCLGKGSLILATLDFGSNLGGFGGFTGFGGLVVSVALVALLIWGEGGSGTATHLTTLNCGCDMDCSLHKSN
jgi:hypothetical protein